MAKRGVEVLNQAVNARTRFLDSLAEIAAQRPVSPNEVDQLFVVHWRAAQAERNRGGRDNSGPSNLRNRYWFTLALETPTQGEKGKKSDYDLLREAQSSETEVRLAARIAWLGRKVATYSAKADANQGRWGYDGRRNPNAVKSIDARRLATAFENALRVVECQGGLPTLISRETDYPFISSRRRFDRSAARVGQTPTGFLRGI